MRQRTADAPMRRAERLAASAQECALVEVDGKLEGSVSGFSGVELSDDGAVEWMDGESIRKPAELPAPAVVMQEHRVMGGWAVSALRRTAS